MFSNSKKMMNKNLNSASAAIFEPSLAAEGKGRRSRSKKDNLTLKLNRHKSDINMTPIGLGKSPANIAAMD